ncbi:unnamed protein product [Closterium sp. NIES-64]|nr:unnamed protein product [Closterium sp. NIES-64]
MLRRLKTRSLPPALLPSLPVPFSPSHTLPRPLGPPTSPVPSSPCPVFPLPHRPHPSSPPPPSSRPPPSAPPLPTPPVFRLPLFPLPRVLPPPSKLSHLLIFPLPQSPPWRLLHLSPIPLAQQAEDAEPIRNGESLMDPPCLHRISRPSHGAAHSSGGATRPSLTGSRPASAPIRTDRPEAQPTARMPPANHGDERKETRHVASAGHHPHPTRSRSYVSSPAELEDAVPPLDAPRDAERRRSFDGSESERASLMRDAPALALTHPTLPPFIPTPPCAGFSSTRPPRCPPSYPPSAFPNRPAGAPICPPAQRQQGGPGEQTAHRQLEQGLRTLPRLKVVIALRESIVFLALIALFAVTPNVCRALNCHRGMLSGLRVWRSRAPPAFVAAAFFLTRHMRLLFSLAKLLPPPSVHNSFSGGGASVGGKSPSSSFPLSLTPSSLSLQYAPSPASSQAPPEPVPPAEVQNGFSGGGGDPILLNVSRFLSLLIHLVGPTLLNASRFLSLLIHLVGVGTVLPQPANHLSHPPLIPPMLCPMHQRPAHQPILLNASRFLSLLIHLVGVGTVLDLFGVSLLSLVAVGGISESEGGSEGVSGHGAGSLWRVHPLPGGCERHLRWAASQVGGISGVAMGFASKEMVASFFGGLVLVFSQPFVVGEMAKGTEHRSSQPPSPTSPNVRCRHGIRLQGNSREFLWRASAGVLTAIRGGGYCVAMGFASKEIVANFFGGLVLVISQPFVVGERIQAGAISGRVEEIGFLHTKLAGANKAPVVVPNQIFNTAVITNFSRARCYPVAVTFELRIEDIERVQAITSRITRMLRSHADVDQSQAPRMQC